MVSRFFAGPALSAIALLWATAPPAARAATADWRVLCDDNAPTCTEPQQGSYYQSGYVGHDEPALLFYSDVPGAGNSSRYLLRLPAEPATAPRQDGSGGTFNFQLHPAFWFGMAMCDSQSYPNPGTPCMPDTDTNIFDNPDPNAADYIGKHPGTAFMEMQFYPPGWALWPRGVSCDAFEWCAALNIDSLSADPNTGQQLNPACARLVGVEYVNFAFVTRDGTAQGPANPVEANRATFTPDPARDLFMNPGDWLVVDIGDTADGLSVVIVDLTTGQSGSMIASVKNGFGQVAFAPTGTACDNIPYAFHPMYATSSEHTRVPWAAHSFNVAFSDEIGHFEYCDQVAKGDCVRAGRSDRGGLDRDDRFCFAAAASSLIPISGCTDTDIDFDGPPYRHDWPGSRGTLAADLSRDPQPIQFASPLFLPAGAPSAPRQQYARVAFETDLPGIERRTTPPCNTRTGAHCVDPPAGAHFYPFYSIRQSEIGCVWQLGGAHILGTRDNFGGSAATEYGALLALAYPTRGGASLTSFEDFRQVLPDNPCPASPQ